MAWMISEEDQAHVDALSDFDELRKHLRDEHDVGFTPLAELRNMVIAHQTSHENWED